jgi:hypothetical protein
MKTEGICSHKSSEEGGVQGLGDVIYVVHCGIFEQVCHVVLLQSNVLRPNRPDKTKQNCNLSYIAYTRKTKRQKTLEYATKPFFTVIQRAKPSGNQTIPY